MSAELFALLDYLAATPQPAASWQSWQLASIVGGANNRLIRATGPAGDFAIKWTLRDARDRAGREWTALKALEAATPPLAPQAVLLERERYPLPVVVQTWVAGALFQPTTTAHLTTLVHYFQTLHAAPVAAAAVAPAVLNAATPAACQQLVDDQLALLPFDALPYGTEQLLKQFQHTLQPHSWATPRLCLCRVDSNPSNFITSGHGLISVDWENSGLGDGAFDCADVLTHPRYMHLDDQQRHWFSRSYANHDPQILERMALYEQTMLIWWIIRLARMLYDIPRGADQRLVAWNQDWQAQTRFKLEYYWQRFQQLSRP